MPGERFHAHSHDATIHEGEHMHVTHHAKRGDPDVVEHLISTHSHVHNHSPVEHAHEPHENVEREHEHEAHVHDHSHPTEDR